MGATLDRLTTAAPPYTVPMFVSAREHLRMGHWRIALDILKRAYDAATTLAVWVELLAEPGSGWERNGEVYCVPGYDALCGDAIRADDGSPADRPMTTAPAGIAVPEVARTKWVWIGGAAVAAIVVWKVLL